MFTDKLREGSTGPAAKILFGIIIVSFAVAGVGSYLIPDRNEEPVKVNKVKIPEYELENQVRLEKNKLERQFGKQFFEQQMAADENFNNKFKASILEKMINDEVLTQLIARDGVEIPAAIVKAKIKSMPEFMVDGKFNQEQYEKVLAMAGFQSPDVYGEALRTDLAKETFFKPVIEAEFALPGEVSHLTDLLTEKRTYTMVNVNKAKFTENISVTDKEIADYYEANKNNYLQADKVKFSYIYLTSDDVKSDVHYTDDDLLNYYNLHSEIYTVPEKREISHILLTGDDAVEKAKEVKAKLDAGADFAELAKQYSQDPSSAQNGGRLPAFASTNQDKSIANATFALVKPGDVSDPVQSDFGVHIIKLNTIIPATSKTFSESKDDVIRRYVKQLSQEVFLDKRQIVSDISFENPDSLDLAAKEANASDKEHPSETVKVQVHDYIASDAKDLPFPFSEKAVMDKIFDPELRETGVNSDVIELGQNAFVVVHIEDYVAKTPKKLEEVKDVIKADISDEAAKSKIDEYVNGLLASLSNGESIENEVASGKITIDSPRTISRLENKVDEEVSKNVFELAHAEKGNINFGRYTGKNGDVYVLILDSVEHKAEQDVSRDDFLTQQITVMKSRADTFVLTDSARSDAKIEYNRTKKYLKNSSDKGE